MKAFTVSKTARTEQVQSRVTAMMAASVNNANLIIDDEGFVFHTGIVNRDAWQVMFLQLLGRGYMVREAIREIENRGIGPKYGAQSISNRYYKTKLAIPELKFRVDDLTADEIMKLRDPPRGIPTNVTESASGMYSTFHRYDIKLLRSERAGAPINGTVRNTGAMTKNEMHLLKEIKKEV